MTRSWSVLTTLATAAIISAACGGDRELATDHIRSVLTTATAGMGADSASTDTDPAARPVLDLPNGDTLSIRPSVVEVYKARGYEPAWTDHDEVLPQGVSMMEALAAANSEGLDRERYHFGTAREMAARLQNGEVEDRKLEYLGNLDLLLTESFVRFAQDLTVGTIDPAETALQWEIERGELDEVAILQRVLNGEDPKDVLGATRPQAPYYTRLIAALRQLREVADAGGWQAVPEGETLEPGDEDPRVAALRARLMAGDDAEETRLAAQGRERMNLFDDALAEAVQRFQTRHNLHEDGALGPNTLAALNVPVEDRIEKVRLNLDRWRWLPHDLGHRFVLVNIAGYELEIVYDGQAIESMNVVVGQTANRTPVFQDTLEYVVVNPYWNVPASIVEEEIIPAVSRDPGYLARNNYEVLYNDNPVGTSVSPSALRDGQYRVRQKPGAGNALGNVKFLFPNEHAIYLHDTPADHLFTQQTRAFSHGCIRVERPDDLARLFLDRLSDRDPSEYDSLRQETGEQWIQLDEKVPVYILYFTAWVNEDGTIRFHEDIYDRDRTLEGEQREKLAPIQTQSVATAQSVGKNSGRS